MFSILNRNERDSNSVPSREEEPALRRDASHGDVQHGLAGISAAVQLLFYFATVLLVVFNQDEFSYPMLELEKMVSNLNKAQSITGSPVVGLLYEDMTDADRAYQDLISTRDRLGPGYFALVRGMEAVSEMCIFGDYSISQGVDQWAQPILPQILIIPDARYKISYLTSKLWTRAYNYFRINRHITHYLSVDRLVSRSWDGRDGIVADGIPFPALYFASAAEMDRVMAELHVARDRRGGGFSIIRDKDSRLDIYVHLQRCGSRPVPDVYLVPSSGYYLQL